MTTCKIDHTLPGMLAPFLCRACTPMALSDPIRATSAAREDHKPMRVSNLTEADLRAIAEIEAEQSGRKVVKDGNRIGKMKAKLASKEIPKGARWDPRHGRWVM